MALRAVLRGTPYGSVSAVVGFLTANWALYSGEYTFRTGQFLGDLPYARLYEVGYFLAYREYVERLDDENMHKAREKAQRGFEAAMMSGVTDEDTGLPAWIVASGIQPADGSSIMG